MYTDKIRNTYPSMDGDNPQTGTKLNQSPLHKNHYKPHTLIFDMEDYPPLPKTNSKRNQQRGIKPHDFPQTPATTISTLTAKEICDQILSDMKSDLTKLVTTKINNIQTEMTTQLSDLKTTLQKDTASQIAKVLQMIQALNQQFTDMMDHLPTTQPLVPAHKKFKGLGKTK